MATRTKPIRTRSIWLTITCTIRRTKTMSSYDSFLESRSQPVIREWMASGASQGLVAGSKRCPIKPSKYRKIITLRISVMQLNMSRDIKILMKMLRRNSGKAWYCKIKTTTTIWVWVRDVSRMMSFRWRTSLYQKTIATSQAPRKRVFISMTRLTWWSRCPTIEKNTDNNKKSKTVIGMQVWFRTRTEPSSKPHSRSIYFQLKRK